MMTRILFLSAAFLLNEVSGWLGGEMVYVRGVAVKQPPDQTI
jgi:hypothetical protein